MTRQYLHHAAKLLTFSCALAQCCCTTGTAIRSSETAYSAVPVEHVQVLTQRPARSFVEIGLVTGFADALGSPASAIRKMREEAAKIGADAILITKIDHALYSNTTATAIRWQ